MTSPDWSGALSRADAHAPFLARAMETQPELAALLAAGQLTEALAWSANAGAGALDAGVALRRERVALALALAIADLAGAMPLLGITRALSDFADRALDTAIVAAIRQRVPDATPAGFSALALGKHGAGELNYSSDIDPILLYDPRLLPRRERDDPGEAAQRVARAVVDILSSVTDEGYVFRVDLRLRPASEVSPPAISIEAALAHYESSALAWERAAFIRARACAGDIPAGQAFLSAIRPFVWRKSLDFGAIADIGRLSAQIRSSSKAAAVVGPGFDIKKGRGGIREIEFYAQTHQLIHGGRNPALRLRGVRETLDALANAGLTDPADAALLGESYDRLRTIEHRLQMVGDQQTHILPVNPAALDGVARLDGLPDGAALVAEVAEITRAVGRRYDDLLAASGAAEPTGRVALPGFAERDSLVDELAALGFADCAANAERIAGWTSGKFKALRSEAATTAFGAIRPQLLEALAHAPEPERALARWEQLLANLPSAINLFYLLEARPALLELLARILSLAPPLADELARRADLLDPLIDASAFAMLPDVKALIARLRDGEADDDYQQTLDRVRRRVSEWRFVLGVQLIESTADPLEIAAALSRVAEAALVVLCDATQAQFALRHGTIAGSEPVILGLGRMGGGALTHASDLDLVFLHADGGGGESDGERPLGTTLYHNRLAQRMIAALSVPTAEGALYEVDTRLRPSGEQGPLAVSFDSFARYQHEQAWTWEHMALCRARPLYGSPAARTDLATLIAAIVAQPRDPAKLREDVLEMRARMAGHKRPKGLLDVKLARGGLVDIEFIVHYLQLREGVGLVANLGAALRQLAEAGLVPAALVAAHDQLARLLVAARLLAPDSAEPPPAACAILARACGCADWPHLLEEIGQARHAVRLAWREVFGEAIEDE